MQKRLKTIDEELIKHQAKIAEQQRQLLEQEEMIETQLQEIDALNQELDQREEEIFELKMENRNFYDVNVIQEQRMNSIKQMMTEKP